MKFEIVIDAQSPYELAHFWAAALQGYEVRPYGKEEIARLAKLGLTPETDSSVPIESKDGPTLWFQKCDDVARTRNRIHLDLKYAERQSEANRLGELGAKIQIARKDHIVMIDPEGNQFCLFDP